MIRLCSSSKSYVRSCQLARGVHPTTTTSIFRTKSHHNQRYENSSHINTITKPPMTRPQDTSSPDLPEPQTFQDDFYFYGVLIYRLALAYGGIYCLSEYGFQLTNCNGPSMLPTMKPCGEIIFIDRLTPRLYGFDGGCSRGTDRVQLARHRQQQYQQQQSGEDEEEWHETESFVPANEFPQQGKWGRFWRNIRSGISHGDIVVVEHPQREGTVCKRVVGLPGDEIILKNSHYSIASHFKHGSPKASRAARKSLLRVPDGHVWLEGDNSANSLDSRSYGTVPAALIVGRVPFRIWPLRENAIMERGLRPSNKRLGEPKWGFQGSTVLPAGYRGERIIKQYSGANCKES